MLEMSGKRQHYKYVRYVIKLFCDLFSCYPSIVVNHVLLIHIYYVSLIE